MALSQFVRPAIMVAMIHVPLPGLGLMGHLTSLSIPVTRAPT